MNGQMDDSSNQTTAQPKSNIAVVTDSTADIPYDLAEQLNIHIIPNTIVVEGKSLIDGKELSRQAFYEQLPAMKTNPTTATASSGVYQELYERLMKEGSQHVLSIHTSGLLSGIINAASAAAQACGKQIHVIDSGSVSMGLGFQVLSVAEALHEGKILTLDGVMQLIDNVRQRVRVIAMVDTLEYIRRSGRVSWAKARLGELLNIKPFIEVRSGQVLSLGETRTRRKGLQRLLALLHDLGPLERLAILHTNAETEARQLLAEYKRPLERAPLFINITTVIGAHVGPGALGAAAIVK